MNRKSDLDWLASMLAPLLVLFAFAMVVAQVIKALLQ